MPHSDAKSLRRAQASRIIRRSGIAAVAMLPLLVVLYLFVDRPLAVALHKLDGQPVERFFDFIEQLGDGKWYIAPGIVAALVLYFARSKFWRSPLFVSLAVIVSGIAVNLLKAGLGRYRPSRFFNNGEYGFRFFELSSSIRSFPSGHATTAFAVAAALTLIAPRLGAAWFAIATLAALGRVVTCAHYLSDVIAGAWLGTVSALLLAVYFPPWRPAQIQPDPSGNRSQKESRASEDSSTTSAPSE